MTKLSQILNITMKPLTLKHEDIACRAYQIWEREGKPAGRDESHWFQAQQELMENKPLAAPQSEPRCIAEVATPPVACKKLTAAPKPVAVRKWGGAEPIATVVAEPSSSRRPRRKKRSELA